MAEPFIGQIIMFGGNFAIRSYAFCNGQLQAIAQNSALFSILGTNFGGDGRTTFGLPEMRGRVPLHSGNGSQGPGLSSYRLGTKGGQEQVTLNVTEMPQHTHSASTTVNASTGSPSTDSPAGAYLANGVTNYAATTGRSAAPMASDMATTAVSTTGGNLPHENRQPWIAINYEIALQGIYPSRS